MQVISELCQILLEWHAHVIIECFIVSNFFISEANVMDKEKKMRIIYFNTDKCTKANT